MRSSAFHPWLRLACAALLLLTTGCATWQPVRQYESWTLYSKGGDVHDHERYEQALAPAFEAVESRLGKFTKRVRIHVFDGEEDLSKSSSVPSGEVAGIGPARVRAFHVRGGASPFQASGVFLGSAEVGTAVHELVHARMADLDTDLPLWFEEGLASLWGDGALYEGAWIVDGLACWPLRVLREERVGDEELGRLLALSASDDYSARENLLVHFVGWAIVFDLAREHPGASWQHWLQVFERDARARGRTAVAKEHLARVLDGDTERAWLERLDSPDPAVRLAACKGAWKLHSRSAILKLIDALMHEDDPQVRYALALNALLGVSEIRVGRRTWRNIYRMVFPALKESSLPDPYELESAQALYRALQTDRRDTDGPLGGLSRYWDE